MLSATSKAYLEIKLSNLKFDSNLKRISSTSHVYTMSGLKVSRGLSIYMAIYC